MFDPLAQTFEAALGVRRSFAGRRWSLKIADEAIERDLQRETAPITARLLALRGISSQQARDYLAPKLRTLLPDPNVLKDMDVAVGRVAQALRARESIAIIGDYDVDGSASAALLHDFLSGLAIRPRIYIPDRIKEGYGPSPSAMRILHGEGVRLVFTVDCGASAHEAFAEAHELGLAAIILDHHRVAHAPFVLAHINPNQSGDESGLGELCAAGVTFLFVVALNRHLRQSGFYREHAIPEPDLRRSLDLVGLATICDVVPLTALNRAFVRFALAQIGASTRPGLAALAQTAQANGPLTPYHLGFVLGPRINAGGRVGRSSLGVELLTTADCEKARELAALLELHNRERKALEKDILERATALAVQQADAPFLLVAEDGWHQGVIGIVASRLKERFCKPTFIAGFEGGMGRGSARSLPGFDVGALVRQACEAKVIDYGGGHAMAAGFSLSAAQFAGFRDFIADYFIRADGAAFGTNDLLVDLISSPAGANLKLASEIAALGPFGAGNPEPLLAFADVRVDFADVVAGTHIKLRLAGGDGTNFNAIAFRALGTPLGEGLLKARGRLVHVAGRLRQDDWNGRARLQLEIEDAALAGL